MMARLGLVVGVLSLQAAVAAARPSGSEPQAAPQQSAPPVRVSVEVIPIDVQVLDRHGKPVAGLGAEKFSVTINGRRHRVLSADLIQTQAAGSAPTAPAVDAGAPGPEASRAIRRVIVLAIDCISFSPGTVQIAIEHARQFISRLPADDLVGLFAYPIGPAVEPTTDRARVSRALDAVVGQRDIGMVSHFHLRPSEIVDVASEMPKDDGPILMALARRECGEAVEIACRRRLSVEATSAALYYEAQAQVSIGALRTQLQKMAGLPGRKTLVLLSAGVTASDRPGGRPDIKDLGTVAGREAARANTAIYTVRIETSVEDRNAAERGLADADLTDIGRDGRLRALWLEQFSGAAGGALFTVIGGNTESAFNRILVETSSYYLLGVEAGRADRTGLVQEIQVKVDYRQATVRSRRWVAIPGKAAAPAPAAHLAGPSPPTPSPPAALSPRPRVPLSPDVQVLADLFERGDVKQLQAQLDESQNLANVIRDFRMADPPWPERPRLAAVFALELGVAGVRSDDGFARDQGARLLAEYSTRIRHPLGADTFECVWLWAETAALGGLLRPSLASGFVSRAAARCPGEPRLHLAAAIVAEQEWLSFRQPGAISTAEVVQRYTAAMKFTETALEARVRAAFFLLRTGQPARALEFLGDPSDSGPDAYVAYLAWLVRGRVLAALGRPDESMAALRRALIVWPGGQAARVALMTLLFIRGDREEAAVLAEAIQTAGEEQSDPWWTYPFGDFRAYPAILTRLRNLAG